MKVALEKPGTPDELVHFGTKGMKWGVRKERASNLEGLMKAGTITRTTKNGDQFTLTQNPPSKLHKALAFASKSYAENFKTGAYLHIKDKNGNKIGEANFWHQDKDTVYLNNIEVKKSARGRGYASEILKAAEDHSRSVGKKKMVLSVPGNSPDARHIYEKMGFEVTRVPTKKEIEKDLYFGGLTDMEKKL